MAILIEVKEQFSEKRKFGEVDISLLFLVWVTGRMLFFQYAWLITEYITKTNQIGNST
jgi:hypothetical protein